MGSNQSSHADNKTRSKAPSVEPFEKSSVRGRKSVKAIVDKRSVNSDTPTVQDKNIVLKVDREESTEDETEDISVYSSFGADYDNEEKQDEDEEYDAFMEERRMVLEEARMLKQYATFHLHPEAPVITTDACARGRNFFDRPSAPEVESFEDMEERARIMEDVKALRMYADFHLHPEKPVATTDPTVYGRNYFSRDSAPEQESLEEAEEKARILEEAALLKQYATFHLHPEKPVVGCDPLSFGRNFFSRPSAVDQETVEEAEERAKILEEAAALKQYAGFHLHPERPVTTSDPLAFGRNYFTRPSAPDQETTEESEERAKILEEAALLKQYATFHLRPEKPVETTDPTIFGRNYFTRASAPEQEFLEEVEERVRVLEEAALLKQYAGFHLHPERPVTGSDPLAFGRNYFMRPSAPEQDSKEESDERARILEEAVLLKQYADFHLHPEKPVVATDPTIFGRNYFSRPSAPEQVSLEDAEEKARILEEAIQLKKYAEFHLHPEKPVVTTDPTIFGRNFFSRPSAPEQDTFEEAEERARILEEAAQLKKFAGFHLHPERPVETTDPTVFGRNFFGRASAIDQESLEESMERQQILEDCAALKKYARFHLHPEKSVVTTDPTVFGRNFFSRPSAPEQESVEEMEQRNMVLADGVELKKYADFHLHPEKGVVTSDPTSKGRNFFTRPSGPESKEITSTGHAIVAMDRDAGDDHYFVMDEEMENLRSSLTNVLPSQKPPVEREFGEENSDEEEGKLSRSPSSVMLFGLEQAQTGY